MNRLSNEKSPYLLQHADNPVDWYPWGEEALAKAKVADMPIFLSIGYSSCHWCHVMEEESFRDAHVAAILNEHFVAVKVDREERPDIDEAYMEVCQAMTGSGGWPLTIITTPEGRPFFAATYIPREARYGMAGLTQLLGQVTRLWQENRLGLKETADRITRMLQGSPSARERRKLDLGTLERAYAWFESNFDPEHGGFGKAPKFPNPHAISFLIRYGTRTGKEKPLTMARETLDAMRRGGIFDHLGYGFHRYSTDERWLVPHFEKMLYDQALLTLACVECFHVTGEGRYRETAEEVIEYVTRDLSSPEGGFFSSEDADSEGEEGKFYTWIPGEIETVLGRERGERFSRVYGVDEVGDIEGRGVLRVMRPLAAFAREAGMTEEELEREFEGSRRELFGVRGVRVRPARDEKILTDWNGLMIAALAKAGVVFGEPCYGEAARRAARFLMEKLRREDGRLLHRYRDGDAAIPAFLDDYAFLVWGLLELDEAASDARALEQALGLTEAMIDLFWDEGEGGFFTSGRDGERLITRRKDAYDGAIPSGNSVAAMDLLRLAKITGREDFREKAERLIETFGAVVESHPAGFSALLSALDLLLAPLSGKLSLHSPRAR
jgi:uncharacterized protein YyaL (SSP411 family)